MKKNIVMLDDDLTPIQDGYTEERVLLQPWLRWLKTGDVGERFELIECNNFHAFIKELEARKDLDSDHQKCIHGIIIDVMWKETTDDVGNFSAIGYGDVPIMPLEAGAQLLQLMFMPDCKFEAFKYFRNKKILVLSSMRGLEMPIGSLPKNVTIAHKAVVEKMHYSGLVSEPDDVFKKWVDFL